MFCFVLGKLNKSVNDLVNCDWCVLEGVTYNISKKKICRILWECAFSTFSHENKLMEIIEVISYFIPKNLYI